LVGQARYQVVTTGGDASVATRRVIPLGDSAMLPRAGDLCGYRMPLYPWMPFQWGQTAPWQQLAPVTRASPATRCPVIDAPGVTATSGTRVDQVTPRPRQSFRQLANRWQAPIQHQGEDGSLYSGSGPDLGCSQEESSGDEEAAHRRPVGRHTRVDRFS
jgi:hypothetical protein